MIKITIINSIKVKPSCLCIIFANPFTSLHKKINAFRKTLKALRPPPSLQPQLCFMNVIGKNRPILYDFVTFSAIKCLETAPFGWTGEALFVRIGRRFSKSGCLAKGGTSYNSGGKHYDRVAADGRG
jgi:hypothetical protein